MARTESNMLALGTIAPEFSLLDTISETTTNLHSLVGSHGTVIMFICNHCPFVIHVNPEITKLANEYQKKGIEFIAISSNDVAKYPEDGPKFMRLKAKAEGYTFPYLYDENQMIAKKYEAACTPDFYLFDNKLKLTYRGQLDDSRPGNKLPLNGKDLRKAIDCLLSGKKNAEIQKPSIGCGIKWKNK